jgi:hypothetical protein
MIPTRLANSLPTVGRCALWAEFVVVSEGFVASAASTWLGFGEVQPLRDHLLPICARFWRIACVIGQLLTRFALRTGFDALLGKEIVSSSP